MSTEVGRGHITVDVNIDEQGFVRASQKTAQRAAKMFGDEYADKVQSSLRATERQFDVHVNRSLSSFQKLDQQRVRSMDETAKRIESLQREIAASTERDRSISDAYAREGKRAADAFAAEQNKSFDRIADAYRRGLAGIENDSAHTSKRIGRRFEVDIDHHSRRGGGILARHLMGAFDGVMSLLPSRLEFLFTRTGPIIGGALMAGISGAMLVAIPALGAMIAGAFAASLGLGAVIGAVLVGIADDNRVLEAARRIRTTFIDHIIYHPDMQNLGQVLAEQLDRVNEGLHRWAPYINSILQAGASFLPGITSSLIAMVDIVLPALDRFINSTFMTDIMNVVIRGIIRIGEAFQISFDRFLSDPQAMEGAKKGLDDLFNLIAGGIKLTFDIIRALSRFWETLNTPQGGGLSPLDRMREIWEKIRETAEKIASPVISAAISTLKGIFEQLKTPLGLVVKAIEAFGNWMADPENRDNIELVTTLLIGMKVAFIGLDLAARGAAAAVSLFTAAGGFGLLSSGGNKDKLKAAGKGGAVGGLAGILLGGDPGQIAGATAGGFGFGPIGALAGAGVATLMEQLLPEGKRKEIDREWEMIAQGNFSAYWAELKRDFGEANANVKELLDPWQTAAQARLREAWSKFAGVFTGAWEETKNAARVGFEGFNIIFNAWIDGVKMRWNDSWGSFKMFFSERWGEITALASQWWGSFGIIFDAWLGGVKQRWNDAWSNFKQFFVDRWTEITGFASFIWSLITTNLGIWLEGVKQRWSEAWGNFKQFFIDIWNDIIRLGGDFLNSLAGLIDRMMSAISGGWSRWWAGIWNMASGAWDGIVKGAETGLNNVIDLINRGIGLINGLLTKLGVSFQITPINHVGGHTTPQPVANMGAFSRMATGGPIRGPGSGTSDSVPILASNGEFMINAKSTRKWFGLINAINNDSLPGFNTGGYIGMFNWIKQRVPGVSLASGYRPGDPGYHGKGMAVDLIFSDGSERRGGGMAAQAFAMIKAAFMPIIRELIWDFAGANAVWNGKNHFFTGLGAGPGTHDDHIHWAQGAGEGGFLSGLFEWLGKGWNALVSELIEPMKKQVLDLLPENNGLMAMGKGWIKTVLDHVISKIKVEFDQAMEFMNTLGAAGDVNGSPGGAVRWTGVALEALKMLGLPDSWLGPLLTLIQRESGGDPNAINRWDSNAAKGQPSQGLMQTIPSTFRAFMMPGYGNILAPLDNILAGLRYIISKYGSIFNVQQANRMMSPAGYDSGGWWPSGTLGVNTSGRPEPVFTGSQWDTLRNANGGVNVTVYVDGVRRDAKAVVEENNFGLINAANRGRANV